MEPDKKINIYGVGIRGGSLIKLMEACNMPIGHIVDGNRDLWGTAIGNRRIESPEVLREGMNSPVCITVGSFIEIAKIRKRMQQLCRAGLYHEIPYHRLIMEIYEKTDPAQMLPAEKIKEQDHTTVIFGCEAGLGLGGIENWTKGICAKFIDEGDYTSFILTDHASYDIPEQLKGHILKADIDRGQMFTPYNMKRIINCIAQYLPCILVTSQPDQTLLAGKILKEAFGSKIKVISGIRGGYAEINDSYIHMRKCTDLYVSVNSAVRTDMIKRGIPSESIYTMLCPVECQNVLRRGYSLDPVLPIRAGFAGRLEKEEKRMDLMIKLIAKLEELQAHYYLEFAGGGSYEEKIRNYAKEHGCENKIRMLGKIDQNAIAAFWQDKDICINISDHEGRSRSTIEAMANGAVPVVTNTWGVQDDITDGENGFIVAVGDYGTMAQRICFLDRNRGRLPDMGSRAYKELRKKCSMDDHYTFWKRMISLVMQEKVK